MEADRGDGYFDCEPVDPDVVAASRLRNELKYLQQDLDHQLKLIADLDQHQRNGVHKHLVTFTDSSPACSQSGIDADLASRREALRQVEREIAAVQHPQTRDESR
ncbi:hypothetical protein BAUCODRAFT_365956 [Baudoinia panamericana UAMH 10762]|uniref:Uncharacterized protein n=1 Tax=Baudoinia panamericana (strain UAMH 10762) TaxID=717646 RepID=M2NKZ0_BAUPA|nr:uncharacterized protein BAUCODRAFT_365956 [Baudoinia panamericana UAMH 10762]EMD00135.1 hypothetical protein BAUCODRAFT_365956 [Baudoinia panamericana UAMH 10762]